MNLPNKLTILRIVMIPFMMFFYLANFIPYGIGKLVALALFILASYTDMLDGKIARKHNLITNFGKFLDPIADKMLTSAVLFMIIADGTIVNPLGAIIVTIIISREFMVSALRFLAASKGVVVAADMWGKVKTVVQMIALPVCIILAYLYTCGFAEAQGSQLLRLHPPVTASKPDAPPTIRTASLWGRHTMLCPA